MKYLENILTIIIVGLCVCGVFLVFYSLAYEIPHQNNLMVKECKNLGMTYYSSTADNIFCLDNNGRLIAKDIPK